MCCTRCITCACVLMMPSVTASHNWDEPPYLQRMNPPLQGSIESVFDQWLDSDAFIVTHKIIADEKGRTKKVRVSDDLSEYVYITAVGATAAHPRPQVPGPLALPTIYRSHL